MTELDADKMHRKYSPSDIGKMRNSCLKLCMAEGISGTFNDEKLIQHKTAELWLQTYIANDIDPDELEVVAEDALEARVKIMRERREVEKSVLLRK